MGPFLEQKASVGFWKFRPRREVHTQDQPLVCRALVHSGPSSQREGRCQEASQTWGSWKEAEAAPDTEPDEGAPWKGTDTPA